jgi:putative membrane protein
MRTGFLTTAALAMVLAMPAFAVAQTTNLPSNTGTGMPGAVQNRDLGMTGPAAGTEPTASPTLTGNEKHFLDRVARSGDYELATARLALQKATQQDIKAYAQRVIADHTQLQTQLQQIAGENHVQLPTGMTRKQQQRYQALQGKSGHAFDQAFINDIRQADSADAKREKDELNKVANNPKLKSLVEQLQQTDTQHKHIAQSLKA